jgi:outer membrane receptor protein involved in Fe transport
MRLGRLTLSAGFRYDYIRIPFEDNLDPSADTSSTFHRWSPRGGLSIALGATASAYASVGRSFRAPAVVELACADETATCPLPFALGEDPPLDPVIGTTYELGARGTIGRTLFDGAVYRTDVRDDISFIPSESAPLAGFFDNIGATRREGVELSGHMQLPGGHTLYGSYAYTRAYFRTRAEIFSVRSDSLYNASPLFGLNAVEVGDRLPLVPGHQIRFGAALALGGGFEAGVDGRYTGTQWLRGDEANETGVLDAYVTADLRLEWERDNWRVGAVVSNVFDSHKAVFGTFNENRQSGELERFLTPLQARAIKVFVRRGFGPRQ